MQEWLGEVVDREDLTRHDKWLCMMMPRLKLLRDLLTENGVIFVSIDDNEVHHLRMLMDEVFGEDNFVATIIWEKVYSPKSTAKYFSENHDYIVVCAKSKPQWDIGLLPRTEEQDARTVILTRTHVGHGNPETYQLAILTARGNTASSVREVVLSQGHRRETTGDIRKRTGRKDRENRIWWGEDKNQVPAIKRFLSEVKQGLVPETIWTYKEVGHTQDAKKGA